jgi:hypothetical protein
MTDQKELKGIKIKHLWMIKSQSQSRLIFFTHAEFNEPLSHIKYTLGMVRHIKNDRYIEF